MEEEQEEEQEEAEEEKDIRCWLMHVLNTPPAKTGARGGTWRC